MYPPMFQIDLATMITGEFYEGCSNSEERMENNLMTQLLTKLRTVKICSEVRIIIKGNIRKYFFRTLLSKVL